MNIKTISSLWAAIVIVLISQPVLASPQQYYDAGVELFKQGQYSRALDYFQRAEAEGMVDDQLKYNLGAVYYKLQRYQASRRYYQSLISKDTYRALAYYNLGLIENKLGNSREAIKYFEKCQLSSDDENLRKLAQKQIDTLNSEIDQTASSWYAYLSFDYGEDSNINQRSSNEATGISSTFSEALGLLGGSPWQDGDSSVHTHLIYYSKDYSEGGQFDIDLINLAADYRQQRGDWEFSYGLNFIDSSYGSVDFLKQSGLTFHAGTKVSAASDLKLKLMHEEISSQSTIYRFLDGNRTRLKFEYSIKNNSDEYRYQLGLEGNDRTDTPSISYSPTRIKIGVKYMRNLVQQWRAGVELEYRVSEYKEVAAQQRADDRIRASLLGEYKITKSSNLKLKLQYTDNDSNEAQYNYRKHVYLLGFNTIFQ